MHNIVVNIALQQLLLKKSDALLKTYTVATARNGAGYRYGSMQTPLGQHIIRAKIGDGQPINTVFVRRRPTGEIYSEALDKQFPDRDWIITRILWLSGCEPGKNRLGDVDTMQRKIYIHGCPDSCNLGVPSSHGCIKMHNHDMIELYNTVPVGTPVSIIEGS